jgi:uncharacterized protein (DUF305 family)
MESLSTFIRGTLILLLVITGVVSGAVSASAQDQRESHGFPRAKIARNEQRFLIESDLAIGKMSLGMTAEPSGDIDRDFVAMMTAHQQGAIDVAGAELKYGHNEALQRLAKDMIAAREHEISVMCGAIGETIPTQSIATPETTSEHAAIGRSKK